MGAMLPKMGVLEAGEIARVTVGLHGRKALYDYSHWTLEGARHFGALAAERNWLAD